MIRSSFALLLAFLLAHAVQGQDPPVVDGETGTAAFEESEVCTGCCNLAHPWRSKSGSPLAGGSSCNTCPFEGCGPAGRFWGSVDLLYWIPTGDILPPLVTTSPAGTTPANAGVLPAATILLGRTEYNDAPRAGLRVNLGGWFDSRQTIGMQVGGFILQDAEDVTTYSSNGTPILARPFNRVAPAPAAQSSQLIAFPDVISGSVLVRERATMNGADFAFRGNVCCGDFWRFDALVGYRYLKMTEQLLIGESMVAGVNSATTLGIPTGTQIRSFDRFETGNTFHGCQVGFTGDVRFDRLSIDATVKASFGGVNQGVGIDGFTQFTPPGGAPLVGGLLALNSNIGSYRRTDMSLVPELNLTLNYRVTDNIRLRAGYDLLYIPNVQRPGGVIDTGIDTARIPPVGAPTVERPFFDNNASDVLFHGGSLGIEFRF